MTTSVQDLSIHFKDSRVHFVKVKSVADAKRIAKNLTSSGEIKSIHLNAKNANGWARISYFEKTTFGQDCKWYGCSENDEALLKSFKRSKYGKERTWKFWL
jgi:hypothetical protein